LIHSDNLYYMLHIFYFTIIKSPHSLSYVDNTVENNLGVFNQAA